MTGPLEFSLVLSGLVLSGLALFRIFSRNDHAALKTSTQGSENGFQATFADAHSLVEQFYILLLSKQPHVPPGKAQLRDAFASAWEEMIEDPTLFPRQPMVLPKLLQAMKSEINNSQSLMAIIIEDPGLTADVLKLANSPIYRNTQKEIDSIEYALVMLGEEGMTALVCSCLMKPIFSKQRGEGFNANLFWEWALCSSQGAQHLSQRSNAADSSTVYMLSLLTRLSELIILRGCVRICDQKNIACSVEQVLPITAEFRNRVAEKLIQDWGFDLALCKQLPPNGDKASLKSERYELFRAQQMAPELGSAAVLLSKHVITLDELGSEVREFCLRASG